MLGITVTSGDVWVKAGVQNMLRMVELTGHGKVPVSAGAEFPLINSRAETEMWEDQFGEFSYKGAWNPARYHEPNEVPTPASGGDQPEADRPARRAADDRGHPQVSGRGHALRRRSLHDGRARPRLDPEIASLAKEWC